MVTLTLANAAPILDTGNPVGFFTNVASRLLASQLNLDLTRIQIYPTNQYTPAVHRLLQIAANIYDASTNRYYDSVLSTNTIPLPTVFQPVFSVEGGNVYITNFVEVTDMSIFTNTLRYLDYGPSVVAALQPNDLVFGVPLIIGAKKGFPNFNEFAMENAFQITRKLQVTRPSTNSPTSAYSYNQMFTLSVSNSLGIECWNSYTNSYARPVKIDATNYIFVTLVNDEGLTANALFVFSGSIAIPNPTNSVWPGYNPNLNPLMSPMSFQIPLNDSVASIPVSMYCFNGGSPFLTTNLNLPFETNLASIYGTPYPQPHWRLVTTNLVQVIIRDVNTGRIIDYVQLLGPSSIRDLSGEIRTTAGTGTGWQYRDQWDTNIINGMPYGIVNQVEVSLGAVNPIWNAAYWGTTQKQTYDEVNAFLAFMYEGRAFYLTYPGYQSNPSQIAAALLTNAMQAPYTSTALAVEHINWQANDPLVHYIASDLNSLFNPNGLDHNINWPANLGQLNQRYTPWGGSPMFPNLDTNAYNLAIKDPLVWSSDNWNFPTGQTLNADWLGQVHRGTPWQTIFLKATNILAAPNGSAVWENWTGDSDSTDAAAMAPVQDWHLASLLASLLNTNDFRSVPSVNNPDPNAWLVLLNGLTAWTNTLPDQFDVVVISSNSPQASIIANAIQSARINQPGGFFRDVGDILTIPQLTEQSPFLNPSSDISDEAYEIIPSQLLSLLRADSIGSIAPTNGQTLVQFTGYDGHAYAIQVSSDLMNWTTINTNSPANGIFNFTIPAALNVNQQFYRSVLLQ